MKVAVLIPDRGDRQTFLNNCLRMMKAQTLQPDLIEIVNDPPQTDGCDITWRYRTGYDRLRNKGYDVIAFIENDDWYSPIYLETMVNAWVENGRPNLFGTNSTIYYHVKLKAYFTMYHTTRASAMNTLIVPDLKFEWCKDSEPFTDSYLWQRLKLNGKVIKPKELISIGIKHGEGLCGGHMHNDRLFRFTDYGTQDPLSNFLKEKMDPNSFEFYSNFYKTQHESNI